MAARLRVGLRVYPGHFVRSVWSEAAALDVEHKQLNKLLPEATIREERTPAGWTLSLRHASAPGITLARLCARAPGDLLIGAASHEALPLRAALPLVEHAIANCGARLALAALPGLCASVAEIGEADLIAEFGEVGGGAALAVALGRPRPGHSVLGQGTFRAAQPAWAVLAARFAESAAAQEVALFKTAGLMDSRVQLLADTSPEALAQSGGAMVMLALPGALPRA